MPDPSADDALRDVAEREPPRAGLRWRALVTLAAFALIFWLLPYERMWRSATRLGFGGWLAVLAGIVALQSVAVAKWRLLLFAAGERPAWRSLLRAHGAGLFANNFLPSLVGGDVVRAGLLARGGARLEGLLIGGLGDRAIDASALVAISVAAGLLHPRGLEPTAWRLLALGSSALGLGLLLGPPLLGWLERARWSAGAGRLAGKLRRAFERLRARPGPALAAFAMALAIQSGLILLNAAIGRQMGLALPLAGWFLVWPLAKLAALAPVSLGGLGVRQLAMAGLLAPFAVEPALAVAQSLVWETLLLGLGLVGGLLSLWLRGPAVD